MTNALDLRSVLDFASSCDPAAHWWQDSVGAILARAVLANK